MLSRLMQSEFRNLSNPCKNVLDGDLIWMYLALPAMERIELARRIGTTMEQVRVYQGAKLGKDQFARL